MIVESAKCWKDLTREELVGLRGYPLARCDCTPCHSMRGRGIPDMPREMLGDPGDHKPTREY